MPSDQGPDRAALRDILHFYADAGVDEALLDEPVDRLAEAAPQRISPLEGKMSPTATEGGAVPPTSRQGGHASTPEAKRSTAPASALPGISPSRGEISRSQPPALPDAAQAARARELARSAQSLDELRDMLAAFDGCNLKFTAKSLCFSDGNPDAGLMLVGEAPGRDEDLQGLPFVGRSGQLLDRMLAAIGRDRSSAYIANTVPWRPPGNREPTPLETEICRPFIERQIELADPKVLVAVGGPSSKFLLRTTEGIMRMRGKWREHVTPSGKAIPTMPTLHPAYLLRNPAHKRLAWRDFLEVKAKLREV